MLELSFLAFFLVSGFPSALADGKKIALAGEPSLVALSQSSETLAYLDQMGFFHVADTRTGLPRFEKWILDVEFARSARQLAVSNDGAVAAFLDGESRVQIFNFSERSREIFPNVQTFALSDDGRYLAVKDLHLNLTLIPASLREVIPLLRSPQETPSRTLGRLAFLPGTVRRLVDTPSHQETDRRLKFISIHKATEVVGNEEVGVTELVRRSLVPFAVPYESRAVEISSDSKSVLTLDHSVAEIWDLTTSQAPLTFANGPSEDNLLPIETATLSRDGQRFAVVYASVIVVARSQDAETIDVLRNDSFGEPQLQVGSVAARFSATGSELVVARAKSQFPLTRYSLSPEDCAGSVAAAGP